MVDYSEDPEYVQEDASMIQFRNHISTSLPSISSSNIKMAFDLLTNVMHCLYDDTSIENLIKRSHNINEASIFSKQMIDSSNTAGWKKKTLCSLLNVVKKILTETSADKSFINKLTTAETKVLGVYDPHYLLPSKIKKLEDNDKIKINILEWINIYKTRSKNKSPVTLRTIAYFLIKTSPLLGIDLSLFPHAIQVPTSLTLKSACKKPIHLTWLKFLYRDILVTPLPQEIILASNIPKPERSLDIAGDGSDKHRIPTDQLESLFRATEDNTRDRLIFLLLMTTGMRAGGLVKIKMDSVCTLNGSNIDLKDTGRTIEKGNKWFSFVINNDVKAELYEWILNNRKGSSLYLFPSCGGKSGHMTTSTVRSIFTKMAKKCGLENFHIHPHSIRHSYAHILLECGNTADTVAKLLGHSSSAITQKYYLTESASEVSSRANIPWITQEQPKKIVPSFLDKKHTPPTSSTSTDRKRKRNNMAKLNMMIAKVDR
jgi:integrase